MITYRIRRLLFDNLEHLLPFINILLHILDLFPELLELSLELVQYLPETCFNNRLSYTLSSYHPQP